MDVTLAIATVVLTAACLCFVTLWRHAVVQRDEARRSALRAGAELYDERKRADLSIAIADDAAWRMLARARDAEAVADERAWALDQTWAMLRQACTGATQVEAQRDELRSALRVALEAYGRVLGIAEQSGLRYAEERDVAERLRNELAAPTKGAEQ